MKRYIVRPALLGGIILGLFFLNSQASPLFADACFECLETDYDVFCGKGYAMSDPGCGTSRREYKPGADGTAACGFAAGTDGTWNTCGTSCTMHFRSTNQVADSFCPGLGSPKGTHDLADCSTTSGWTCDPDNFSQALQVNFYRDGPPGGGGVSIGNMAANSPREAAVASQCGGSANHGFSFPIGDYLKDGKPHTIYAQAVNIGAGGSRVLDLSPKTINCSPPAPGWKSCAVSSSAPSGYTVGQTINAGLFSIIEPGFRATSNLYFARKDGKQMANPPGTEKISGSLYFYHLAFCPDFSDFCNKPPVPINNLPAGDYYISCDVSGGSQLPCTGNPFCNGNEIGGMDCTGLGLSTFCSTLDAIPVTIANPPASAPIIQSFQVDQFGTTAITGKDKVSGLRTDQGGKDWLNPIFIKLDTTKGTGNITNEYVAFYDQALGKLEDKGGFISTVQNWLIGDPTRGFLLRYEKTTSKHYVWDKGEWFYLDMSTYSSSLPYRLKNGSKEILWVAPNRANEANWYVSFLKDFGGKPMYTASFVIDSNNLTAFVDDTNPL